MIDSNGKPQKKLGGWFGQATGQMTMAEWLPLNANHTSPGIIPCQIGPLALSMLA